MNNASWIEDATSEFCSPVLMIPKGAPHENKGYRFMVDLRQLNARTKSLPYMIPELGEMWAKLRNNAKLANGTLPRKSSQNIVLM